jgi:dTDP-4-amino-4,6-dideoxygalactose transaminase
MGLKPSVVIAVDLFGQPADVEAITEIAMTENIKVLVDGAQSFGAAIDGNRVGSMGDATTTSFFPAKPLGCYGDGGAILTNNDENASTINSIRLHGKGIQKYDNVRIGLNSRLDTIQAAILIEKLKIFEKELDSRNKIASRYTNSLIEYVKVPEIPSNITSAWAQYTLTLEGRDKLQQALKLKGIPSVIYYPIPLSKQKGYSHYPTVSSGVSNSEQLALNVLSLPMHPYMNKSSQEFIINEVISNI